MAFLPHGKIVLVAARSEIVPDRPGYYLAASIKELERVAFAHLVRAHRVVRFSRMEAFGKTRNGISHLFSYSSKHPKRLAFCCNPKEERFEIFGYDKYSCRYQDGRHEYYAFRHGEWYLLRWYGPVLMSNAAFESASKRAYDAVRSNATIMMSDPLPARIWSAAYKAGAVTMEELDEAGRRHGSMWNYSGS